MMDNISARCLMCGKTMLVDKEHKDFKKLVAQEVELPTFICDYCSFRVQHESEEKNKPQKPM
jgi:uncharacterized protein YlaI